MRKHSAEQILGIQILKEVNSKNGKPHAEEFGGRDCGRHVAEWSEASELSDWAGAIECPCSEGTIGCRTCEGWARGEGVAECNPCQRGAEIRLHERRHCGGTGFEDFIGDR